MGVDLLLQIACKENLLSLKAEAALAAAHGHADVARWLSDESSSKCSGFTQPVVLRFQVFDAPEYLLPLLEPRSNCPNRKAIALRDFASGIHPDQFQVEFMASSCSFIWAETLDDAREAVSALKHDLVDVPFLAVDLECYDNVVCTIQLATACNVVLLDSLRLHHVVGGLLKDLFASGSVHKLFHAPRNDLRWLQTNFGLEVTSLFDTATAATLLQSGPGNANGNQSSLKCLCDEFLGIQLDKTHQRSDWRLRPLPKDMLHYAAWDAKVLLPLSSALVSHLDMAKLLDDCCVACDAMADSSCRNYEAKRIRIQIL